MSTQCRPECPHYSTINTTQGQLINCAKSDEGVQRVGVLPITIKDGEAKVEEFAWAYMLCLWT